MLSSHIAREYLDSVHDNFVLAPADKASNNVIIICKKFYYDVLARELGVDAVGGSSGNDTYKTCSIKEEKIVHDHISFLGKFNITLDTKDKFLPSLYWLPKLHKDPYKFRYIAASSHCTTKHLSILLTNGLEKIQRYFMSRCKIIFGNSGINGMWILKNSQSLLQSIKDNHVDQYDSISTWDFSTLYTTIPYSDLLVRVKKLIKLTFNKNEDCHLLVNGRQAYFSQSTRDGYLPFSCSGFCDLFEFLISNIYIKFGAELFRQIIGIPMGTNCAPLLANLYLFSYEYDFMMNLLKKKQLHLARKFNFSYGYIDDLISFNNPEFKKYYKKSILRS